MNKLYNRIITKLASKQIDHAWVEGYNLGLAIGDNKSRNEIIRKLESLEIEKFNETALILGFNTALELVKETK